jgi:hypothetical protein
MCLVVVVDVDVRGSVSCETVCKCPLRVEVATARDERLGYSE